MRHYDNDDKIRHDLKEAFLSNNTTEVAALLNEHGSRAINNPDRVGRIVLHYAAFKSSPEIVKMLLDNGADPEFKTSDDKTAIDFAIQRNNRLLDNYADPELRTAESKAAINLIIQDNKKIIDLLEGRIPALEAGRAEAKIADDDVSWSDRLSSKEGNDTAKDDVIPL